MKLNRRCTVCDEPGGSPTYLGGSKMDHLCHKCWRWSGELLFGWRAA